MSRKVIQLGEETLVVSLPSAWARQHSLRKGSELEAEEDGSLLVLYPKSVERGKAAVDVSNAKPMVKRILGALYKNGYNEFEVAFSSQDELDSIKEVMAEFIGFEIVEEGKKRVLIRNVSHIMPEEFGSIQRKMAFVIATMAEESLAGAVSGDKKKLELAVRMDADVNRYADFCRRILSTLGHRVVRRAAASYYIVEQLEKVGDSYRDLAKHCLSSGDREGAEAAEAHGKVNAFFRKLMKAYFDFSIPAITEFAKEHYALEAELSQLLQKASSKDVLFLVQLKIAESDMFNMNGAVLAEKL